MCKTPGCHHPVMIPTAALSAVAGTLPDSVRDAGGGNAGPTKEAVLVSSSALTLDVFCLLGLDIGARLLFCLEKSVSRVKSTDNRNSGGERRRAERLFLPYPGCLSAARAMPPIASSITHLSILGECRSSTILHDPGLPQNDGGCRDDRDRVGEFFQGCHGAYIQNARTVRLITRESAPSKQRERAEARNQSANGCRSGATNQLVLVCNAGLESWSCAAVRKRNGRICLPIRSPLLSPRHRVKSR